MSGKENQEVEPPSPTLRDNDVGLESEILPATLELPYQSPKGMLRGSS